MLAEDLGDELTLAGGLRWAALLHDIAKSETRVESRTAGSAFPGHDSRGAEMARAICGRLNTSQRFSQYVAALTRHHLRLGFPGRTSNRCRAARSTGTCVTTEPVEVEVGVLSVADRLATRGRKSDAGDQRRTCELAVEITDAALDFRNNPLPPLVRGDELAEALGIDPGPRLGELLAKIAEARFVGEISTSDEAVALAPSCAVGWPPMSNDPDCIFCAIATRTGPAEVVEADDTAIAFLDIAPATRGHTLVIPRNHAENLLEIEPEDLAHVAEDGPVDRQTHARSARLRRRESAQFMRTAAWQTVFHFHMHVIPRYADDPLRLPWTPGEPKFDGLPAVAQLLR